MLEAGYCACILEEITIQREATNGNFYAEVWATLGPNHNIYGNVHFTEMSVPQLQQTMMAVGLPYLGVEVTSDDFAIDALGAACIAEVTVKKGDGTYKDRNQVKSFLASTADVNFIILK